MEVLQVGEHMKFEHGSVVKVSISVVAAALIVAHLFFPQLKTDSTTLGLLAIGVIPWVYVFLKSAKLPGGLEVNFREIKDAGEKITAGVTIKTKGVIEQDLAFLAVADQDPNLALVGLRIEIEKRIRAIAHSHGIPDGGPLRSLIRNLNEKGILSNLTLSGVEELVMAGNQAAHGASVGNNVAVWALNYGPAVIAALDESASALRGVESTHTTL
jgi:hypothetical protein